jgi:hypothetical protein
VQAKEIMYHKANLNRIIADYTGQPLSKIEEDTDRDRYMSPLEAKVGDLATACGVIPDDRQQIRCMLFVQKPWAHHSLQALEFTVPKLVATPVRCTFCSCRSTASLTTSLVARRLCSR